MQMPSRSRSLQVLGAALRPSASRHVFTVLEIEQAGVPGATTWFRVRPAEPGGTMPTPVVPDGSTPSGQWFSRAAPTGAGVQPKGVQQYAFAAAQMENSGSEDGVPPAALEPRQVRSYVVEAWSDRTDLGPNAGELLASSAALRFTFDDGGFSCGLRFEHFAVEEHGPGRVTVSAMPSNASLYARAETVTWFGMRPRPAAAAPALPSFSLDTMLVGADYSTRLLSPPRITLAFSSPGVHYLGIYGAWNGGYGYWRFRWACPPVQDSGPGSFPGPGLQIFHPKEKKSKRKTKRACMHTSMDAVFCRMKSHLPFGLGAVLRVRTDRLLNPPLPTCLSPGSQTP